MACPDDFLRPHERISEITTHESFTSYGIDVPGQEAPYARFLEVRTTSDPYPLEAHQTITAQVLGGVGLLHQTRLDVTTGWGTIEELIDKSSLGTPEAKTIQSLADQDIIDGIIAGLDFDLGPPAENGDSTRQIEAGDELRVDQGNSILWYERRGDHELWIREVVIVCPLPPEA
jgi:hypothetical protein